MSTVSQTRYARSGDIHIAYQIVGDGPIDLVFSPSPVSNLEVGWEWPPFARFLGRLGSFSRLILFDKRGTGLSDRVTDAATLEERMDDLRAVMDAAGSECAAIFGSSEGGPMALLFAATYPERVSSLVLYGSYAKALNAEDYDAGVDPDVFEIGMQMMAQQWGNCALVEVFSPSVSDDETFRRWWGRYERQSASPGAAVAIQRLNARLDVRPILPSVRVPTLIIYRAGEFVAHVEGSKYLAHHIAEASFVELEGNDYHPYVGDQDAILDRIEGFLTGITPQRVVDRVLATLVLIAPAIPSAEIGDDIVARIVAEQGGQLATHAGHGYLASFDGPSRAVLCALAIRVALHQAHIEARIVAHVGEIERRGIDMRGAALDQTTTMAAIANVGGDVLISRTLADLIVGSGFVCSDAGTFDVAGASKPWPLFSVSAVGGASAVSKRKSADSTTATFRREGDTWLLGFDGRTTRLHASKGLAVIAKLLANPGREFHVIELVGSAPEMPDRAGADPLLDEHAIAEFRNRLAELADEADEADAMHDLERAATARAEYDIVVTRLSADLALGGRSRASDAWPERARKTIRKRIQDAFVRIEAEDPALGRHLRRSIKTGAFCSYDPSQPVIWVF